MPQNKLFARLRWLHALFLLSFPLLVADLAGTARSEWQAGIPTAVDAIEREVWWSAEQARILQLGGSWKVHTGGGIARLRPEDPSCSLTVLATTTGDVQEYEFQPEGELALAFGWIMVSPSSPILLSERVEAQPFNPEFARISIQHSAIEKIVFRGREGWHVADYRAEKRRFTIWRRCEPQASGVGFEVHSARGDATIRPAVRDASSFLFLFQESPRAGDWVYHGELEAP